MRRFLSAAESYFRFGNKTHYQKYPWQMSRCDPRNLQISFSDPRHLIPKLTQDLKVDPRKAGLIYAAVIHLAINSEHIAPHPVLTIFTTIKNTLIAQVRDFGKGLGAYLNYVGLPFSTRDERARKMLGLDECGNGIMLSLNQVLSGCVGRAIIESSGETIMLSHSRPNLLGMRYFGSKLEGTRFLYFFPLNEYWIQEPSGWETEYIPQFLPITFNQRIVRLTENNRQSWYLDFLEIKERR